MRMIVNWLLSALALLIVAYIVPGFQVSGIFAALLAAVVIGLINATIGLFLKVVTFPLTVLTLGIFWFVVNAIVLKLATWFVPGFNISRFLARVPGSDCVVADQYDLPLADAAEGAVS